MPAALSEFRQDNPAVELELWDMDTATIARWVAEGKVDFGIGGVPDSPEINFDPLLADELVLVYPNRLAPSLPEAPVDIGSLLALPCITNGIIAASGDEPLRQFHAASRLNAHNTAFIIDAGRGRRGRHRVTAPVRGRRRGRHKNPRAQPAE